MTLHREKLLRFIRAQPRSTQACREHMDICGQETEEILRRLRDEGAVHYANGEWYVFDSRRATRKKPAPKVHLKQMDFFDPEAGSRPFSRETQELFERWKCSRYR